MTASFSAKKATHPTNYRMGLPKIMTGDQSRQLNVGDRVCWHNDKNDQGTITETDWAGVTIKWDNRSKQAILHNDMTQVDWVATEIT